MRLPKLHWSLRHREHHHQFTAINQRFTKTFGQGKDFSGVSPSIFVGRHGYPHINLGFLSAHDDDHQDDAPFWKREKLNIPQILGKRLSLLNADARTGVKDVSSTLVEQAQEVALSVKPVDTEVSLSKIPALTFHDNGEAAPYGPRANLQKVRLTSESKIKTNVQRIVDDTDLKASEALHLLSHKNDEHFLAKALSVGSLGVDRKLVPTRWSITAVDDTLSKQQLESIRTFDTAPICAFQGNYLGNYCLVLFLDGVWSYELFEMHQQSEGYTTDHEFLNGRTAYAEQCAGGYYASRLAVTEYCFDKKQQGTVVVLRMITDEYDTPLGVWVFREAMRNAMMSTPLVFNDTKLLLSYARAWGMKKFNYSFDTVFSKSKLLGSVQSQLSGFNK